MAENDRVSVHSTRTDNKVVIHRVHSNGHRTLVGYYTPDEAVDIGARIISEAGAARERSANKQRRLKSAA